jgi:putative methionine-R-sulfoxide reductase with GAF domain
LGILDRMSASRDQLLSDLGNIVSATRDRVASLQEVAIRIRSHARYRWVGLYKVDHGAGVVTNLVWSGPGAPEYPTFPLTKGLTGAAVAERQVVNVGDVSADPRYLTAFGTTRSEIIVPVFSRDGRSVIGTIDVESEKPNAFNRDVQTLLQACSEVIRPLWEV